MCRRQGSSKCFRDHSLSLHTLTVMFSVVDEVVGPVQIFIEGTQLRVVVVCAVCQRL